MRNISCNISFSVLLYLWNLDYSSDRVGYHAIIASSQNGSTIAQNPSQRKLDNRNINSTCTLYTVQYCIAIGAIHIFLFPSILYSSSKTGRTPPPSRTSLTLLLVSDAHCTLHNSAQCACIYNDIYIYYTCLGGGGGGDLPPPPHPTRDFSYFRQLLSD